VLPKKDLFMGGGERERERVREIKDCLFPCNDKLQNPLQSLMIKYIILYDPWWDSFIDTDPDVFLGRRDGRNKRDGYTN
jgi:hypothetical protein